MKRSFTILTAAFALLAFLAIPMGMMGQTRAEVVAYTLEPVAGSNNSYTGNCDITIDGITWNLTGNSQMIPWRIGGKNLAGVDRTLYSKTAIDDNVSSISVTHGNVNLTVNSWTVVVASDASFNNVVSTLTPTFAANTTTTIAKPTDADWSGCYYKFEYNVTAGSSNKYLEFSGAVFYKEEGSGPVIANPTFDPAGGDYFTTQNVTISCETQGSTIYYTTDGSTPDNSSTQYNGAITVSETTTIKAIAYVGDDASSVASATYNIVQPLTTMQAIFDKATEVGSTATYAYITLGNWVVSGVSTNGKNVFVTDGSKGFVIFDGGGNTGFAAGNILSGTVYCKVQLYNGFSELTLLNSTTSGISITTDGTVTTANIAMADLAGVNTGALLHYDNLTCSIDNNKYYLSDGTTSIQVYNAIYAFEALVDGKTYNITGVYQQFNNTKEILPRSAADIEEVVSTEPTITLGTYEINVNDESHDIQIEMTASNMPVDVEYYIEFYDANGNEIEDEDDEPDWLTSTVDNGIVFCIISPNTNTEARTAYFKVAAYVDSELFVSSDMVTVNQAAYVEPSTWVLTNLADLTEDDIFVIVGTDNDTEETYAIPNNGGTNAPTAVAVTVVDGTLSGEPDAELQWNVSGNANDGYTFYPNGDANNWLYCSTTASSGSNNNIKVGTGNRKLFVLDEDDYLVTNDNNVNRYLSIYYNNGVAQDWRGYINTTNGAVAISFYKKTSEPISENPTLDIVGYTEGSEGGYYLIASPVTVDPSNITGMTEGAYDLFYFDENQENEWQNYKREAFNLVPGKGYLYAKQATESELVYQFELSGTPYNQQQPIVLSKHEGGDFSGWNLVGNPYYDMAYLSNNRAFYVLDDEGKDIIASDEEAIGPTQGFFVIANEDGEELTISTDEPTNTGSKLVLNVSSNRCNVIDRAIVRFDEGSQLPKFQLRENSTKVSIAKENNDYAVVRSEAQGEMPVSFKASENGNYTFSVNAKNAEMNYLHLIDNMTGADIDLIATPSYSFEAKTSDYTNRFRLVFSANNGINEQGNDNFAFFNGSELIVNNQGEAILQVVDILGRVISNQNINGNESINLNIKSGAYMIRLINGNDVKTQKIVVE